MADNWTFKDSGGTVQTMAARDTGSGYANRHVPTPAIDGGCSIYRNISLLATGISIKGTAGQVYGWRVFNANAAVRYLKLYNISAAPTVGTTVPVMTIPLAPSSATDFSLDVGIAFASGIGIGATTGIADNDTGAPSANDVVVNIFYK